jgi:hypothetical protein
MRNIVLAISIALAASATLYLLATGLSEATGLNFLAEVAKGAVGLPALSVQQIYGALEKRSATRALAQANFESMISAKDFSLHPFAVFLLSLVAMWGVVHFTGALMGALVALSGITPGTTTFASLVGLTSIPLKIIAAAYIGRWIGIRSQRYGFAVAVGSIGLGCSVSFLAALLILGSDKLETMLGTTALSAFLFILPDFVIYVISGVLGVWRGQRQRLANHLAFIMKILPEETRQVIVEMVRDEAIRARQAATRKPASLQILSSTPASPPPALS